MWHCESCNKYSCNANGDGAETCPKFVFEGLDWPICKHCYEMSSEDEVGEVGSGEKEAEGEGVYRKPTFDGSQETSWHKQRSE